MNLFKNKTHSVLTLILVILLLFGFVSTALAINHTRSGNNPNDAGLLADAQKWGAAIFGIIGEVLRQIVSGIAWLVGAFFDTSVAYNLDIQSKMEPVRVGWQVSRDIANVFFIIILLGIAIATIFRISNYQAKALLPKLIIIALLINFSLAIGSVIVDFTNILGQQFLNAFVSNTTTPSMALVNAAKLNSAYIWEEPKPQATKRAEQYRYAQELMGFDCRSNFVYRWTCAINEYVYKIPYIGKFAYGFDSASATGQKLWKTATVDLETAMSYAAAVWGNLIFLTIFPFVLFVGGVLLFVRTAVLLLLLALAPLAFLFYILPDTQGIWRKWWDTFLKNAFYFPAFMLLIYISLRIIQPLSVAAPENNLLSPPVLITYLLTSILLIGSIVIARMMGIYGAGAVIGFAKSTRKFITGYAGGAALRQTVGRAGMALQRKEGVQRSYLGSRIAGGMAGVGKKLPGGSRAEQVEKRAEFDAERVLKQSPNTWGSEFANLRTQEARSKFLEKVPEKNKGRFIATLPPEQRQIAINALRLKGAAKVREFEKAETQYSIAQTRNTPGGVAGYFAGLPNEEARERAFRDAHPRDRLTYFEQQFNNPATRATMPDQMRRFANELETDEQEKLYKDLFREAPTRLMADVDVYQNIPEGIRRDIANSQPSRMAALSRANATIEADIVHDIRNSGAEDKYINAPGAALRRYWQGVFARNP